MILTWYLILILLIPTSLADKDTLPVFLLDYEGAMASSYVEPNPFAKLSSAGFSNIILNAIKNSEGIIIFVEDSFCIEDISTKDRLGSPFYHLRKGLLEEKVQFLPAVIEPYRTLKQMFQPQEFNVFRLSSGMKLELIDNFKYIYVFFQDGSNETRSQVLRRHDLIIKDVYLIVRELKRGPVLAFYTGKMNPVVVEKVAFVPIKPKPVPKDMGVFVASTGALFRFSGVYVMTGKRRSQFNELPMVAEETWTRRRLSTKMAYTDFELKFNFSFGENYWSLDNVVLLEGGEEVGRTEMGVGAPLNYSYVCGEPLILVNTRDGSIITISQYQIQPRTRQRYTLMDGSSDGQPPGTPPDTAPLLLSSPPTEKFGKSVNCAPYFTSAILSCLFVTSLLLGIVFYGIITMFNCHSNNRYDDPHGRPLVLTEG